MPGMKWPRRVAILALCLSLPIPLGIHTAKAANVAATPTTAAFATATGSSKSGAISITVSSATSSSGSVQLTIAAGKMIYSFSLPATDFTQTSTTATLDTHGDLKGYGSLKITWKKKVTSLPGVNNQCTGTSTQKFVYYESGAGTGTLKLPCMGSISVSFGGPVKVAKAGGYPNIGAYSGVVATLFGQLSTSGSLSVTFSKGKTGSRYDVNGLVSQTYSDKAPLTSQIQSFHVTFPSNRMTIKDDLSTASLDLSKGPKPLKHSSLQWTATGPAKAATTTSPTTCKDKPGVGATRTAGIQGTVGVQTCTLTGSFSLVASRTLGQMYSSSAKGETVSPLKVVKIQPADKSTGVSTSLSSIVITFSNPMTTQSAFAVLTGGPSTRPDVKGPLPPTLDSSKKVITFAIQSKLLPNTKYTINGTALDQFQQQVAITATFTTGSS